MRVYVPSTLPRLASALGSGSVPAGPGYAVTPALREWYAGGSDEELEYAALTQAARASLQLLAAEGGSGPARRVVLAIETEPSRAASELGDAEVTLAAAVPWAKVAAAHVDAVEAGEVVEAALAVWDAARNGDEDAMFAVEACEGEELLWYATQEVPDLLTEVGVRVDGPTQRS
jgi:hypothetical protein